MSDNEAKARELVAEATKKLSGSKGFLSGLLGGGQSRVEDAMELLVRAANMFKMAKNWKEAGNTFVMVSDHKLKGGSQHDAATNLVDAANCFKKNDPQEAAKCLQRAIDIYTDMGRFTIAAKHHQTVAEIYENDVQDLEKAMTHYEKAADYFKGEESNSSANKCMLKVANQAAQLEQYDRAIAIYEQVATAALESNLLKHSAKEHFFRALLCHLCVDAINAQNALSKYEQQLPAFGDSREAKLVKALLGHIEEEDAEAFGNEVKNYDSLSRLDPWFVQILLKIKKHIAADDLC